VLVEQQDRLEQVSRDLPDRAFDGARVHRLRHEEREVHHRGRLRRNGTERLHANRSVVGDAIGVLAGRGDARGVDDTE